MGATKIGVNAVDGLNLGNVPLSDYEADWLKVMAAATNSSLRGTVASICRYFIRRRREEYREIVVYLAARYGLTFDECFHKLRNNEPLGEALAYFPVDETMEARIASFAQEDEE